MVRSISSRSVFSPDYQQRRLNQLGKKDTRSVDKEMSKIGRIIKVQRRFKADVSGLEKYQGRLKQLTTPKGRVRAAYQNRLNSLAIMHKIIELSSKTLDKSGQAELKKEVKLYSSTSQVITGKLDTSSQEALLLQAQKELDNMTDLGEKLNKITYSEPAPAKAKKPGFFSRAFNWVKSFFKTASS